MKKIVFIISLLSNSLLLFSQLNSEIYLGYNSSKYLGSSESNIECVNIPGISIGYSCDIIHRPAFDIETGIGITSRGSKLSSIGDSYIRNIFLYLELPVIAKLHFAKDKVIDPYIFSGPSLNAKLLCFNYNGFIDDIRKFDLAISSGAGLNINRFSLRLRYTCGILDFDISDYNNNLRNSTFSIEFGCDICRRNKQSKASKQ